MNTKQIDCALELARTLNFNRAAENLFMSQSSLSYQIAQLEEEVGFRLFDRSGRGATLTPAGAQFLTSMRSIRSEIVRAVELGQNFSSQYRTSLSIGMSTRTSLLALPDCMRKMRKNHPDIDIVPVFGSGIDAFLRDEQDLVVAYDDGHLPRGVVAHPLYKSRIYLVTLKNDPLASRETVGIDDLRGRTLMVGGPSPAPLRAVQQRAINQANVSHFNSNDHMTTLVNVAAGKGVCLSPGMLNDGSGEFAWVPFECEETLPSVLLTREDDRRSEVAELVSLLQDAYAGTGKYARLI